MSSQTLTDKINLCLGFSDKQPRIGFTNNVCFLSDALLLYTPAKPQRMDGWVEKVSDFDSFDSSLHLALVTLNHNHDLSITLT